MPEVEIVLEARDVAVYIDETRPLVVEMGPQGPPGPPGASGGAYVHQQLTPATMWIINHNLGFYPDVTVLSTGLAEVDAEVVHISVNQVRVYFVTPFAGIARCE
jgi:hypothetical protein